MDRSRNARERGSESPASREAQEQGRTGGRGAEAGGDRSEEEARRGEGPPDPPFASLACAPYTT